jgi:acyl-CoA dehydrogenase
MTTQVTTTQSGISFEIPERIRQECEMLKQVADNLMRSTSRYYDEHEHERPQDFVDFMWPILRDQQARALQKLTSAEGGEAKPKREGPGITYLRLVVLAEQLSWGDVGMYLCLPSPLLAGSAIEAVGTTAQKLKFLERFATGDQPRWGAMAMTEPGAGSDTSALQTTATFDAATNEWVLNGEKIFCTNGKLALEDSEGLVVVWATLDRTAGRAGMKPFVVPAGTPGVSIGKVEHKHGIRVSDTAAIVLDNARVPFDHILGSPDVVRQDGGTAGFKGLMSTFDASRPLVAATAIGVGRAALDFLKETLAQEGIIVPYGKAKHDLTAIERDVIEMEAQLKAAWLLTLRAAAMLDHGIHNSLEASMAKAKAGKVTTLLTQKVVEILGPMGYSREWLVEKWMRDAKISDLYEGTGQINLLIVARRILGYSSKELQ